MNSCAQNIKSKGAGFAPEAPEITEANLTNKPSEIFGISRTLSSDHSEAIKLALQRGQHKVRAIVPYGGGAKSIEGVSKKINIEDEFKRIYFHKIDLKPIEESEGKAVLTLVFHVIDNPIPLVPIIWAGSIVASLGAGVFFVDKVESFTNSFGGWLSIGLAGLTLFLTLRD